MRFPIETALPVTNVEAYLAEQGSVTGAGELMVCVKISVGQFRHVFMLPIGEAAKLRDHLTASLRVYEVEKETSP